LKDNASTAVNGIEADPVEVELKGQENLNRALGFAAAGGHNVLTLFHLPTTLCPP
jgi:hypothetical protein